MSHLRLVGDTDNGAAGPPVSGEELLRETAAVAAAFLWRRLPAVPDDDPLRREAVRIAIELGEKAVM